jgi:hypothetical protein
MNKVLPNFIIGGTYKSATTSVFSYLSDHPEVCGSTVKETAFFIDGYHEGTTTELAEYSRYFEHFSPTCKIIMEASPGYLANASIVAGRIVTALPSVKVLFILRDPVDRLYSYFNFHKGRLTFDGELSFEAYLELCRTYSEGSTTLRRCDLHERHLQALQIGRYADYLRYFFDVIEPANRKIMFYEDFVEKPFDFMGTLCGFLDIDSSFYATYNFRKLNATFSARSNVLHKTALRVNETLERQLRQRSKLKRIFVQAYKFFNQESQGYAAMNRETRSKLSEYYSPSNARLAEILPDGPLPIWLRKFSRDSDLRLGRSRAVV